MLSWVGLLVVWVVPFQFYGLPTERLLAIVRDELFFRVVYVALCVSTLFCILPRVATVVRRVRVPESGSSPSLAAASVVDAQYSVERATASLRATGARRQVHGEGWSWGVRNRFSPLGSLLFHLAFFLVIAAAIVMLDPSRSFQGEVAVAEGESFDSATQRFASVETSAAVPQDVSFTVSEVTPGFYEDILLFTQLEAVIENAPGVFRKVTLASPWVRSDMSMVAIKDFGYTVRATAVSSAEATAATSVYKLKVFPSGQQDTFDVQVAGGDYRISVVVYGDYVDRKGIPGTASFNLKEPRLMVGVKEKLGNETLVPVVPERLVEPGDSVAVPGGSIRFDEVAYYGVFRVTTTPGAWLVVVALLMLGAGTSMRLLFPRAELLVAEGQDGGCVVRVRDESYRKDSTLKSRLIDALTTGEGAE